MKIISYLSFSIGIILIAIEIFFKFNDLLGYIVTTVGILLTLTGLILNKKGREFLINLFINLF